MMTSSPATGASSGRSFSGAGGGAFRLSQGLLGTVADQGNHVADRHLGARRVADLGDDAVGAGGHLHSGFVGLDLEQHVIGLHRVARRSVPGDDEPGVLHHAQG